jgi:hypothetical protein
MIVDGRAGCTKTPVGAHLHPHWRPLGAHRDTTGHPMYTRMRPLATHRAAGRSNSPLNRPHRRLEVIELICLQRLGNRSESVITMSEQKATKTMLIPNQEMLRANPHLAGMGRDYTAQVADAGAAKKLADELKVSYFELYGTFYGRTAKGWNRVEG